MEFKDKLNFLMKITQVSNKELSKAIAVDPSLVSLLRSGKRKPPQNNIHIINMANFFVKKIYSSIPKDSFSWSYEHFSSKKRSTKGADNKFGIPYSSLLPS